MRGYRAPNPFPRRAGFFAAFVFLITAALVCAQANPPSTATPATLTATEIVQQMLPKTQPRPDRLKHYQSIRHYQVEYKGYAAKIGAKLVVEAEYDAVSGKSFRI